MGCSGNRWKLRYRQPGRFAIQHSAVDRRPLFGLGRGFFLLPALFFLSLEDLAISRADPDIGGSTLVAVTADYHYVVKDFVAIAPEAAGENFARDLAGGDLDRSIHGKDRAARQ